MKKIPLIITALIGFFLMGGVLNSELMAQVEPISPELVSNADVTGGHQREMVPLTDLLTTLEQNFDATFLFKDDIVQHKWVNTDKIQVGENTGQQLAKILQQLNLTYYRLDRQTYVLLSEKGDAQEQISGTVTDAQSGETLPGVNILVQGTSTGTSTDANGKYELSVESLQDTLVVSFVGYKTQEVPINGRVKINVALQTQAISGEEMVVVGYGTQKKKDLTGSVKSINTNDLPPSSASEDITNALRGRVAGLNITGGNSTAGDRANLTLRGQNSLSAGQTPLIVVDGIIFHGNLNDINTANVKKINVLKDASAAAIYGSQASNGVILVTTKSGSQGKPTLSFSSYGGIRDYTHAVPYMNGEQYAERLVNYNYIPKLYKWYDTNPTGPDDNGGRPTYPDISDPDVITSYLQTSDEAQHYRSGNEVNWMDVITRSHAPVQNYNLSLSGGTEDINYYISGSYKIGKGIIKNDDYRKNTFHTRVNGDVTDWLSVGLSTSYSHRDYSGIAASLELAQSTTPLASVRDENGNYPVWYNNEFSMAHPLGPTLESNEDINKYIDIHPYAKIKIPQIKGLSNEFNYSYNLITGVNSTSIPSTVYAAQSIGGQVTTENSKSTNVLLNDIIHYKRNFLTNNKVNVTLLYSYQQRKGESNRLEAQKFQNQILGYHSPEFGQTNSVGAGAYQETSIAYMARVNYGFMDKYLLTGTIRRDGYSGFGSNNKYATFPSLSAAWVASGENFMQNIDWINLLKLRISYGTNGNQGIGRYTSLSRLATMGYVYGSANTIGIYSNTLGNNNLKWEKTGSFNIGIDYEFIKSRVSGTIDLYTSKTKDVLVNRALPGATGYNSVSTNIGGIKNRGIDFELSTINLTGSLRWETQFIYSINRNKITKLYGNGEDDIGNSWFIGEPISAFYDYENTGRVWAEKDLYNGNITKGFYPGQFKLADLNNDGEITAGEDRTIVGYAKPNYRFSISNSFFYKNFSLSFLITSIQGGNGYYMANAKKFLVASQYSDFAKRQNQPAVRTFWTPFNGVTDAPSIYNYPQVTSGEYVSKSFIRLQNVSLGYTFDKKVLNSVGIKDLKVYVNGKNLYTWTDWPGYDPELAQIPAGTGNDPNAGSANDQFLMRSITAGINISF